MEPVSNLRFLMLHEIWMLFISPANPAFCGQTPSTGKDYYWPKRRKTTEINLAVVFVEHTNTQTDDMDVNTRESTLSSHKEANKHIISIHKQNHTHRGVERPRIPRLVNVYLKTRGSCECSQVGLLCMYVGARKTLLTAVRHFDCPAWLLYPKPPSTPTLQHPPSQMAFFFFLTVCGLLHLCSTTLNPWDGWVEWKVWSSAWTNGLEVAEQIKRIKRSLFTDTSKLFWRWAMDPPHTHPPSPTPQQFSPSTKIRHPQRHFYSIQVLCMRLHHASSIYYLIWHNLIKCDMYKATTNIRICSFCAL